METLRNLLDNPFHTLLLGCAGVAVSVYFVGLLNPVTYVVAGVGAVLVFRAHNKKG